jgi:CO/xanthine dehydrogenase FAD-binding subunit
MKGETMSSRGLPEFELLTPQSITEAVDMLAQHQSQISILNGGTALWNHARKLNHLTPYVLSLSALKDLDYIKYSPGEGLRIGARTTIAQLIANPAVTAKYSALHESGFWFGNTQVRNMATVMGNILRASPSADCSCAILALGGQVVLKSQAGQRIVDIDDFWLSYDVTARKSDELAVEIRIPEPKATTRATFQRLTRVRQDLAKLNVAVRLEMDHGVCQQARIAVGCVGPTTIRLKQTEKMLQGKTISDPLLKQIAASAGEEISPIDDQRSTADYRRQVAGVLVKRAIVNASAMQ